MGRRKIQLLDLRKCIGGITSSVVLCVMGSLLQFVFWHGFTLPPCALGALCDLYRLKSGWVRRTAVHHENVEMFALSSLHCVVWVC